MKRKTSAFGMWKYLFFLETLGNSAWIQLKTHHQVEKVHIILNLFLYFSAFSTQSQFGDPKPALFWTMFFSRSLLSHKQAKCVRQQEFDHIWKSHKNLLLCRLPLFALPFSINTCQKDKFQEIFSMWFPSDSLFSDHLHEIIGVRTNTREGSQTL